MRISTTPLFAFLAGVIAAASFLGVEGSGHDSNPGDKKDGVFSYLDHAGASGTQHNRKKDDQKFFTTNSQIPLLPRLGGFLGTHGTYRFVSVIEQTLTLIGEPKHGLWRVQDNGFVREYRKKGMRGIFKDVDPNAADLSPENMKIIKENYASFLPEEGKEGYKYPENQITIEGYLNYVDLTIYHPKYEKKYESHVPIDLAFYYCIIGQADYPHAWDAWNFAVAQPMANKIGPLGKRAGMDIKENYLNADRMDLFPDAGIWINTGINDSTTDFKRTTLSQINSSAPQTINFKRADASKIPHEVYLFERPYFNERNIFVNLVVDFSGVDGVSKHSYVRPDGAYWEELKKRNLTKDLGSQINHFPSFPIEGQPEPRGAIGLPVYGHHHPDRLKFDLTGGACPDRGGDVAHYPWDTPGGGWPTNYQEIGPICDGVCLDVKAWANLWTKTWADDRLGLGNAGFHQLEVEYRIEPNVYGIYTDDYLKRIGETNPYLSYWTKNGLMVKHDAQPKPDPIFFKLNFTREATKIHFTEVPDLGLSNPESLIGMCPEPTCSTEKPTQNPTERQTDRATEKPTTTESPDDKENTPIHDVPTWAIVIIVLQVALIVFLIGVSVIVVGCRGVPNRIAGSKDETSSSPPPASSAAGPSYDNKGFS